ncbi:hypothetical protein COM78_20725 [Bacillus thuringiensis]|nr:hypothetical protein COM78_20725 [Bacillus thuringiensis]
MFQNLPKGVLLMNKRFSILFLLTMAICFGFSSSVFAGTIPPNDLTTTFSYTLKRNALLISYQCEEDKKYGSYPSNTYSFFVNRHLDGGEWDYKSVYGSKNTYIFDNRAMTGEDLGNMHFGYIGRALGLTTTQLLSHEEMNKIWSSQFVKDWSKGYFDEVKDRIWIMKGAQMWDNKTLPKPVSNIQIDSK